MSSQKHISKIAKLTKEKLDKTSINSKADESKLKVIISNRVHLKTSYKLFLDDLRDPPDDSWTTVRSYDEGIKKIKDKGSPETISFDHDLGTGKTGDDFAKWLIDQHLDGMFKFKSNFKFLVHSANPVGSVNIRKRLDNFLKYIK